MNSLCPSKPSGDPVAMHTPRPATESGLLVTTDQPELLALHAYWIAARGDRAFPRRKDIDPAALRAILDKVMIIGAERPGAGGRPRFRYRLIGTGVTFSAGYDLTGQSFDDLPDPQFRAFCQSLFERALTLAEPVSAAGDRMLDGARWAFDSILLPLSEDGATVDAFLAALVYPPAWNDGDLPRPAWNWHQTRQPSD